MVIGYFDESTGLTQPGRDHAFLALWGAVVSAIMVAPLAVFNWHLFAYANIGATVVLAYALNRPFGRRFGTDWTERAEFLTGVAMGTALYLVGSA